MSPMRSNLPASAPLGGRARPHLAPGPLALLVLLMALVSGQACAAEHQPTPTTAPPPDVRSILAESGAAMALLDTFRFELTHQRGGTPVAQGLIVKKVVGDVKKPDTLEFTWQGTFSGFFVTAEVIALVLVVVPAIVEVDGARRHAALQPWPLVKVRHFGSR